MDWILFGLWGCKVSSFTTLEGAVLDNFEDGKLNREKLISQHNR